MKESVSVDIGHIAADENERATSGVFRRRRKLTLGEFTTREAANELF